MVQAPTKTVSLGEYWNGFIDQHVASKRFGSATDVIRESLRLLEEKEADSQLAKLRAALIEGEESGDDGELDMEAIKQEALQELADEKNT